MSGSRRIVLGTAAFGLVAIAAVGWAILMGSGKADPVVVANLDGLDSVAAERIGELVAAARETPRGAAARGHLGMAYQANNLRQAAAKSFEQAAELDRSEAKWRYLLAVSRSMLGDTAGALAALDAAIELNDAYVAAHWRRGDLLRAMGDWPAAETAYRRGLGVSPQSPAALVGMVRVELQRKNTEAALALLGQLIQRFPNNPFLQQVLGQAYRQAGRDDDSKAALARGRPGEPRWPDPWVQEIDQYRVGFAAEFKKALKQIRSGQLDRAISLLESLRARRPNDVTLLTNLGAAYINVGKAREAASTLELALVQQPTHFGIHLNLSAAYEKLAEFDKALRHIEMTIRYNSTLAAGHVRHGVLLMNLSRPDEALAAFARARECDASDLQNLVYSGWIECRRKRWAAAIPFFDKAVAKDATVVSALCGLALARMETGLIAEAREALALAERLSPDDRQYRAVKLRFDQIGGESP